MTSNEWTSVIVLRPGCSCKNNDYLEEKYDFVLNKNNEDDSEIKRQRLNNFRENIMMLLFYK